MKVSISVIGRFWAFELAHELSKRGFLEQLITTYPKFKAVEFGIPREKIDSFLLIELLARAWRKLPSATRNVYSPYYFLSTFYDAFAAKTLKKSDVYVGWAGYALKTLRRAKQLGAKTVLERGSSHIEYQQEILREEREKFGIKVRGAHLKMIEKELQEYNEADYITVPSSFVKRTFLEKGFSEAKLIQVPFGVDLSAFHQIPKTDDVFRVIFTGGMMLRKGVHYLLQAFSELKLPNSELLLIGTMNNEMKPFFKKYEGCYRYVGHVPREYLHKYYSQGSVFAIMSIEEGLALVQPQAMACGLPVVCTTNTGGEDIVRDGKDGFVIPIRDVGALQEKLLYLYENQDICNLMGRSAKERVRTGFTWDDYGKKIIKEYEKILLKNKKNHEGEIV